DTIEFDGRLTLATDDTPRVLIEMLLQGSVDIGRGGYRVLQQGSLTEEPAFGVLTARFETAQRAKPWAAPHLREQGKNSVRYKLLAFGVFLVAARVDFEARDGHYAIQLIVQEPEVNPRELALLKDNKVTPKSMVVPAKYSRPPKKGGAHDRTG